MNRLPIQLEPSVLAADFGHLADEVHRCVDGQADALHLDVMDGHFVRNFSMGLPTIEAINRVTDIFLDVHLMIYNPFDYIESFVRAGADSITIHLEATEEVEETLEYIHRCNVRAGLALCPETSVTLALKYLQHIDHLLLMTVHPGFGGQSFMPEMLEKIGLVREVCRQQGLTRPGTDEPFVIQVDGGINFETAQQCYRAGANNFVMGTYLFEQPDMKAAMGKLRQVLQ